MSCNIGVWPLLNARMLRADWSSQSYTRLDWRAISCLSNISPAFSTSPAHLFSGERKRILSIEHNLSFQVSFLNECHVEYLILGIPNGVLKLY